MNDYLPSLNLGSGIQISHCYDLSPTLAPSMYQFPNLPSCSFYFNNGDLTCVLTSSNQQVKCFGRNFAGGLGYGDANDRGDEQNEMSDYLPFVNFGTNFSTISLHSGNFHGCVISSNQEIKCWGRNTAGELGYGDTSDRGDSSSEMGDYLPIMNIGSNLIPHEMSFVSAHRLIKTDTGLIKCVGQNSEGQCGYSDTNIRGDAANEVGDYLPFIDVGSNLLVTSVHTGFSHSCVVLETVNKDVKCWGRGANGQLGQENAFNIGDSVNEMGDNIPPINFGDDFDLQQLVSSGYQNFAISTEGKLKCFGDNSYSQLGIESSIVLGDSANDMGNYLQEINVGTGRTVLSVGGGIYTTCAILDDFGLKCWGRNFEGQAGYGDTNNRGGSLNTMGDYLDYVNLGTGLKAESLHIGHLHSCVVLSDNSFKCWGDNVYGQLGKGHTNDLGDEPNEMGDYLASIDLGTNIEISLCLDHSPTLSPSNSLNPSISPSFQPTSFPSISFSPSLAPSTLSPSFSLHPSFSPTLGTHLQFNIQDGGTNSDESYEMAIDSSQNIIIGGHSMSNMSGYINQGGDDLFVIKYSSNLTRLWNWNNGLLRNSYLFCYFN